MHSESDAKESVCEANSVADSLKNLSNNDTSMKFGGFKGQMMLYPKKHLDIKKIQYGG